MRPEQAPRGHAPPPRAALSTHPPTPIDDTSSGSLELRAETTPVPATLLSPESADPRKTAIWAWSKADTEHRRHVAATQPTLAPLDAFLDMYSTVDDLAAIRRERRRPRLRTPPVGGARSLLSFRRAAGHRPPPDASGASPAAI